jgi:YHS domain-containing protein
LKKCRHRCIYKGYLQIDRGSEVCEDEAIPDPACGMRIGRSSAAASDAYHGHPYYFCSVDCQQKFAREPAAYVKVQTM